MKISWGYRVTILYLGFVGLIAYFVTRSMNEKIDLVSTDYYAQELKYQDKIESIERNNALNQPTLINYGPDGIEVIFPQELKNTSLKGTIHLFRPSDDTKDLAIEIKPDNNLVQRISAVDLVKGMYRVKVEYTSGEQNYFTEKQIVVR
ncbi:MAG TPA: FixH family protein [Bacteroidia bacterium]|nr:FixH family protein [Bacteroidia bacterium]